MKKLFIVVLLAFLSIGLHSQDMNVKALEKYSGHYLVKADTVMVISDQTVTVGKEEYKVTGDFGNRKNYTLLMEKDQKQYAMNLNRKYRSLLFVTLYNLSDNEMDLQVCDYEQVMANILE